MDTTGIIFLIGIAIVFLPILLGIALREMRYDDQVDGINEHTIHSPRDHD